MQLCPSKPQNFVYGGLMEFPQRKKPNRKAQAGDVTAGSEHGTDFHVAYQLNQFQKGSFVMRFPHQPSKNELLTQVAKYGLVARDIKEITATPLSLHPAARARPAITPLPASTHWANPTVSPAEPTAAPNVTYEFDDVDGPEPSTWLPGPPQTYDANQASLARQRTSKKRIGCLRPLLGLAIAIYLGFAYLSDATYYDGQLSNYAVSNDAGFIQKISECNDLRSEQASINEDIWGEAPGLFDDRASTFALHPANLAFVVGCVKG